MNIARRGMRARRRRQRWLGALLALTLVVFIGVGAVYGVATRRPIGSSIAQPQVPAGGQPAEPADDSTNILLLGVDQRPGDYGRSDTMLLLSLDRASGRIHVVSIPRDTMVSLPGHGRDKINAAYAYGGPQLAKQAVADLTGLPVHYYIQVNLQGFARIVDLVGGVDINVEKRMDYEDPTQDLYIHLKPGLQHLNGAQALQYVRFRSDRQGDLGRIGRQQGFLKAIGQQILTPSILPQLPALIGETAKMLSTDIAAADRITLALAAYRYYGNGVDMSTLPGEAKYVDGISYFIADQEQLQAQLAAWKAH